MTFDKQVSETCKVSYFHICALRHIQSSPTTEACKTIAAAIVGSRLDYCNSLLAGTFVLNFARLQLVQNILARVVTEKSRFCRITPALSDLHWLPLRHRLLVSHSRFCSSSSHPILSICVPTQKTAMAKSRSFSSVASCFWNKLPCHFSSISTFLLSGPLFFECLSR